MVVVRMNCNWLYRKRLIGILAEHRHQDVVADLGFGFVGCGDIDEDIAGINRDFCMV